MNKLIKNGRVIFAIGIAGLAILCIILRDFIVGRPPQWPASFSVNPALAYLSASMLIIAAIAIILQVGRFASFVIAGLIFFLSVLRHLPAFLADWPNAYKSLALLGGTLIIAASFYREKKLLAVQPLANKRLIKTLIDIGCILIASFFIAGGYAHFKFADFVKDFIPAYIPFHIFWTYFTAICLLAGGIGLLLPPTRRLAALLGGIMIGGWFLFLHIPRFFANINDVSDRLGLCESFTFAGILFVLAGMLSKK